MDSQLYQRIYSICGHLTGNPAIAHDAADTVFDRFTRKAYSTDNRYLVVACRHAITDAQRRATRHPCIGIAEPDAVTYSLPDATPLPAIYFRRAGSQQAKRVVFCLSQGYSMQETADAIGTSSRSVRRIKEQLRARLASFDPNRGTPLAPIVDRMRRRP